MIPLKCTADPAAPGATLLTESNDTAVPYRLPVYLACSVLALITNYHLGKDMAWDTLNYHLYAGFSALNDRFAQDYFAAGPPSYFNPYAYVPFFSLVNAGMSALAVSSILAAAHSLILWLTYELAVSVCPSVDPRKRLIFGILAVGFAFMNPVLMQQLGSSFADITTAELVVAGWVLLAGAARKPNVARIVCAGLLLGAATALKPTNAIHAIAGIAVLILLPVPPRGLIRFGFCYVVPLGLSFLAVNAPWSYRLARMFGNPLFPLLNGVFRSPEFTTEPLRHFRFIPESFGEALWRPFAMVDPANMVHEELPAPDLRYAVLVALLGMYLLRWLWRRLNNGNNPPTHAESAVGTRSLAALGCGLAADWAMWLSGSGNSRYFLPMACVAAVVVIGLIFRLFASRPKVRNYILAAIFATQAIQLWMGAGFRWNAVPWGGQWFNVSVPEKLAAEPNLYLTMGSQSNSFIAPFLASGAGLVNFSGGYALASDGPTGARVEALIRRFSPHLRVLLQGTRLYEDEERHTPRRSHVDDALERFRLRVDTGDCATIVVHGLPPDLEVTLKSSIPVDEPPPRDTTYLVSCRVIPSEADRSLTIARRHAVDLVLDRLEDACPELFQPRRLVTEHDGDSWQRIYVNTDLTAWVSHGWIKFRNPVRGGLPIAIGRESDWAKTPPRLACGRSGGDYYAKTLNSTEEP
jgi:hypothetical protein